MKHAVVLALAPDRRSGRVLGNLVTADDAVKFVKEAIHTGRCPDARFPQLVAVGINDVLRQHRFTVSAEQVAADEERFAEEGGKKLATVVELGEKYVFTLINDAEVTLIREMYGELVAEKTAAEQFKAAVGVAADKAAEFRAQIAKLEAAASEAAAYVQSLKQKLAEAEAQAKIAADVNQRIATLEGDLATAQAEAAKVPELQARLAEAAKPKAEPEPDKPGKKK